MAATLASPSTSTAYNGLPAYQDEHLAANREEQPRRASITDPTSYASAFDHPNFSSDLRRGSLNSLASTPPSTANTHFGFPRRSPVMTDPVDSRPASASKASSSGFGLGSFDGHPHQQRRSSLATSTFAGGLELDAGAINAARDMQALSAETDAYGFPPAAGQGSRTKRERDEDDAVTPLAQPGSDAYNMAAWAKRRSSAGISDARFNSINLNSRRDSLASSGSDYRRSSGSSWSNYSLDQPYANGPQNMAYLQPQPHPDDLRMPLHATQPQSQGQIDAFAGYGFPAQSSTTNVSGDSAQRRRQSIASLDPAGSPHSSHGSFPGGPDSNNESGPMNVSSEQARKVFGDSTAEGENGSTSTQAKKETPYSRSPEMRVSHKMAERKRRKEMKELFDELRGCLPVERGTKASKWETLTAAVEHIKQIEANAANDRQRIFELETIVQRMNGTMPYNTVSTTLGPAPSALPPLGQPVNPMMPMEDEREQWSRFAARGLV